jgi:ADP-heptose:LPS heptosyltransferase
MVTWGGLGDLLVCTPAIKAVKLACPDRKVILYCRSKSRYEALKHNPFIDSVRMLTPWRMWRYPHHLFKYLFRRKQVEYYNLNFQQIPVSWIYSKNVKEIAAEIFHDIPLDLYDKRVQLFFTRKEEMKAREILSTYRNPVLMHIHSRSSDNHCWPLENWAALVSSMPDCTFIQIGYPDEPTVPGAIDWKGKTSLREALCLLKYASSFVGIDSSMAHATNAFGLPGVVLFGDSSPLYWGHSNNINIYKGVRCSPCFYYTLNDPCPYGHECMRQITVDEVRRAIRQQLRASPAKTVVKEEAVVYEYRPGHAIIENLNLQLCMFLKTLKRLNNVWRG